MTVSNATCSFSLKEAKTCDDEDDQSEDEDAKKEKAKPVAVSSTGTTSGTSRISIA